MSKKKAKRKVAKKKAVVKAQQTGVSAEAEEEKNMVLQDAKDEAIRMVAEEAHEENRNYCISIGDDSQPAWKDAPIWQKESALAGVRQIVANPDTTPEESHEGWLEQKELDGWSYGPIKDPEKKQHPCFVPYSELPEEQRIKDDIFGSVVRRSLGIYVGDGVVHEEKPRAPGTMGRPSNLDADLVERALKLGFTKNQVNGFTENGPLEAACDRCKPMPTPAAPKKKRRPVGPNAIPDGAVDHVLELKSVTTPAAFNRGQNRAAFDNGIISSAMFQLVKDNRAKYKIYPKVLTTVRHEVPDKAGNRITEIRMVVALETL